MVGVMWRALTITVVLWLAAVPAGAVTVVSGEDDSNTPLVIDPSTQPSGASTTTSTPGSQELMFIQRMPVTKVVDEVTLGDLAVGPGCSATTASAKVIEYNRGALGNSADAQYYSLGSTNISTTPSKLTWHFSPITLRKGRGYAFAASASGCPSLTRTMWAHNEPQVNPGPDRCTQGPSGWRRMWHEQGVDDRVPGCVDGQSKFDATMPSGWMISQISQNGSGLWDILWMTVTSPPPVCRTPYPPNTYEAWGGTPVYWRLTSYFPYYPEYTCHWTQWADYGLSPAQLPEHGWYHAIPWHPSPDDGPRDMYLKLETAGYDALLEAHAPVLKYDSGETFHTISPGAMTDFADPPSGGYNLSDAYVNRLLDDSDNEIAAAGSPGPSNGPWPPIMTLGVLGQNYWFGPDAGDQPAASLTHYLNPRGSSSSTYAADAASMEAYSAYADKVYGRIAYGGDDGPGGVEDGKLWLQYWMFYYHNPIEVGEHEGDWEMIQVGLDSANAPEVVAYSQHTGGQACDWEEIELSGGRPVVYVAEGSHASYFGPDQIPLHHFYDHADGLGGTLATPDLDEITSANPGWVAWPGTWGNSGGSPEGPRFQSPKWDDPTIWKSGLDSC